MATLRFFLAQVILVWLVFKSFPGSVFHTYDFNLLWIFLFFILYVANSMAQCISLVRDGFFYRVTGLILFSVFYIVFLKGNEILLDGELLLILTVFLLLNFDLKGEVQKLYWEYSVPSFRRIFPQGYKAISNKYQELLFQYVVLILIAFFAPSFVGLIFE
jgi:hypothetical protein